MRKLSRAFLIAGIGLIVALTGCGGGGGGGGSTDPDPPTPGQVIITGTVRDNRSTPQPVAGVLIKLNGQYYVTSSTGQFSVTLPGPPVTLPSLMQDLHFYVSTRTLNQTDYSEFFSVRYNGQAYQQTETADGARIPIPSNVYSAASGTVSLGVITVTYNDPDNPPPPPL